HRANGGSVGYDLIIADNGVDVNEEMDVEVHWEWENPLYLRYSVNYTANTVTFILTGLGFEDIARTHNEKEVARVLDNTPMDHVLVKAMYSADTEDEARYWLNQLSGEIYTTYPAVAIGGMDGFRRAVETGVVPLHAEDGRNVWATFYSDGHLIHADDENAHAAYYTRGGVAGIDLMRSGHGRFGLAAGLTFSGVTMEDRASDMFGQGHHVGMYAQYESNALNLSALAGYGQTRHETERDVALGKGADAFAGTASSKFNGQ